MARRGLRVEITSGAVCAEFNGPPSDEGTIYRAPTGRAREARGAPAPGIFVSMDSKGVTEGDFVSMDSKGVRGNGRGRADCELGDTPAVLAKSAQTIEK